MDVRFNERIAGVFPRTGTATFNGMMYAAAISRRPFGGGHAMGDFGGLSLPVSLPYSLYGLHNNSRSDFSHHAGMSLAVSLSSRSHLQLSPDSVVTENSTPTGTFSMDCLLMPGLGTQLCSLGGGLGSGHGGSPGGYHIQPISDSGDKSG